MKRHTYYLLAAGVILGLLTGLQLSGRGKTAENRSTVTSLLAMPAASGWVAGPGAVEPVSESIKVGSEITGKLQAVLVDEGDQVKKGQVIAILVKPIKVPLTATRNMMAMAATISSKS